MVNITKRQQDIISLLEKEEIISSTALANQLHVSSKTIRNDIKQINQLVDSPCILANKGSGFSLVKNNELLKTLKQQKEPVLFNRNFAVLKELLSNNKIDFYDLADKLYISEGTLQKSIMEVNEIIIKRNIQIEIKRSQNYVSLQGKEEARRQASTYFLMHEISEYDFDLDNYREFFYSFDMIKLKEYILSFNKKYQINMKDFETISFVMHVAIMIERVLQGNEVLIIEDATFNEKHLSLAKHFYEGLKEIVDIHLSQTELNYLSCLFTGKLPIIESAQLEDMRLFEYDILQQITDLYQVNLKEDLELCNNLLLHLMGLKNRIINQTFLNNPFMEDIKKHFPIIYDISVFIAMRIEEKFNTSIFEDEIGYITLHLMGSFERMHKSNKRKILVISPMGEAGNGYLKSKLTEIHELNIEIVAIISIFDLKQIEKYKPDLIISFLKFSENINIPVYICDGLLTNLDIERIYHLLKQDINQKDSYHFFKKELFFPEQEFTNNEDVIRFLSDQLYIQGYVEKDYASYVIKREMTAPTAYGNLFAIPHPIEKIANQNMVAICSLKKAIMWHDKKVKLIFLFSLTKERDEAFNCLFEQLVALLDDEAKVKQLIKTKELDTFIEVFTQ